MGLREEVLRAWPNAHSLLSGLTVLLSAAMTYLVIRSHNTPVFAGLELQTAEGWQTMEELTTAVLRLADAALAQGET